MRDMFSADWAFAARGAIERTVRERFPQDLRSWPLLHSFDFDAYFLPNDYGVIVLKDKRSGVPAGPGVLKPFPHTGHPNLPPRLAEIDLWQFYLRSTLGLREEDAPFLIPLRDSGSHDASKDFAMFSAEEQRFWTHQMFYVVGRYKSHMESMNKQTSTQPQHITYNVSGSNARVNINSADSSVNITTQVSEVFAQLRSGISQIHDASIRDDLARIATELEASHGTRGFLQKYREFISAAADHMSVLGPVLPALTGLLG